MWHSYGIFQFPSVLQRAKSGQEAALKSKTERKKFDIPEDFMREIRMLGLEEVDAEHSTCSLAFFSHIGCR